MNAWKLDSLWMWTVGLATAAILAAAVIGPDHPAAGASAAEAPRVAAVPAADRGAHALESGMRACLM